MRVTADPDAISPGVTVLYDGHPRPSFEPKIKTFFSLIGDTFPWIRTSMITIDSNNTFPHGAGIASSASAMSALALCLMHINDQISGSASNPDSAWWYKASEISRLGSGSACRSVFPVAAIWGRTSGIEESSDLYAIPWENKIASIYKDYQDTILVVSSSEKAVSSTAGHSLMNDLAYAETRYAEARRNIGRLIDSMQRDDDVENFISIVESEALQLHALMMSGSAPFILMEPGTISIIREVWRFRKEKNIPVCFTLDAGPNVHLLYPSSFREKILGWINSNLIQYCAEGKYILDQVGAGPEKV
jgi:diphosphomevalonate decarboxylase